MNVNRLERSRTAVLVIDMQAKLLPHMHNAPAATGQVQRLLAGANVLKLPVLVAEQYPKGLGPTVPEVQELLGAATVKVEKMTFTACTPEIQTALRQREVRAVLVAGIEAHVCVLQTCLDLLAAGYMVALCVDAVGSRWKVDHETAIQRMIQAGVVPTTVESALLEMVGAAGTAEFKAMLPVVK